MKLVAVEVARVTQPWILDEVRPTIGAHFTENVRLIAERYSFVGRPTFEEINKGGARFANGRLIAGDKRVNIADATFYSNGLQVTASHTSEAQFVIADIIAWAISTLGYRKPQTAMPAVYESHLVVDFEAPVERILKPFQKLKEHLEGALAGVYGLRAPVHLSAFGMGADPLMVLGQLPPPYPGIMKPELGLVPRLNQPFTINRFFSTAPFSTEMHLELLQDFDDAAAGLK